MPTERESWAGSSRSARWLLFAYLGLGLVSRVADANPHDGLWHVPWVIACYVLPIWYVSGRLREPWLTAPWALLLLQGAVVYVPLALFGPQWVGGVDGLLGALVLLTLRSRLRWAALALLVVVELVARNLVGLPYEPAVNAQIWFIVAYLNVALGLYGLTLASTVLERLESTIEVLAETAVDRQRLATAQNLQTSIIDRLEEVRQRADAALASGDDAKGDLTAMGVAARAAAVSARRLASALPESGTPSLVDEAVRHAVADRVVMAVVILFSFQYLANTIVPTVGGAEAGPITNLAAVLIAATMVLLQLHHSRGRAGARPRYWGWTFAAQVILSFALYPVFGVVSMLFLPFVAGSALILIRHPVRWVVFAAATGVLPLLTILEPGDLGPALQAQWSLYAATTLAAASLLIFGLARFARASVELADARQDIADAAVTRERVRIARDTHDTLGLALSTIALKSDLAQALLERDPDRAHREVVQAMHLAHTVAADAASVVHGTLRLDLAAELTTAQDAMRAAGIRVKIDVDGGDLPDEVETQLAAVLREAIANVLRHSDARNVRSASGGRGMRSSSRSRTTAFTTRPPPARLVTDSRTSDRGSSPWTGPLRWNREASTSR